MVKIWTAPLFLTKLDEQFAQRDAGLKKPVESPKRSFAIPDQRPDKTSPFDSYLDSLNVEAIKDKLGKYEAMIEKGRLLPAQLISINTHSERGPEGGGLHGHYRTTRLAW
jgi:hypothetical protein